MMKCSFCRCDCTGGLILGSVCLCPECLAQLTKVSPAENRYDWFVSAFSRAAKGA